MCYSIEPRNRRYVKRYGFLSFAKKLVKIQVTSIVKNVLTVLKSLQQMH